MLGWFRGKREIPRDPYGIAVHNDVVRIVGITELPEDSDADMTVDTMLAVPVGERGLVEALREASGRLPGTDRRCVISASDDVVSVETFNVREGNDLRSTLETETLRIARFGTDRMRIALAAGGDIVETDSGERRTVAFASVERLDALMAPFTEAGFDVVAVDYEGCAWHRAAPMVDVLIVERATDFLVMGFERTMPHLKVVPITAGQLQFGSSIGARVGEMLHDHDLTVKTVAVLPDPIKEVARLESGPAERVGLVARLSNEKSLAGLGIGPLTIGGDAAPIWALAYGLATYAIAERIDDEVAYAF